MALAMDLPPMRSTNWTRLDMKAEAEGQAVSKLYGFRIMRPAGKRGQRVSRLASLRA